MGKNSFTQVDATWEVIITTGGNHPVFVAGIFENHVTKTCDVVIGVEDSKLATTYELIFLSVIDALRSIDGWMETNDVLDQLHQDSESASSEGEGDVPF